MMMREGGRKINSEVRGRKNSHRDGERREGRRTYISIVGIRE